MKKAIIYFILMSLITIQAEAASVKDLLSNALLPVGKCLYVYGGGWNEADTRAGAEAMTYGISSEWENFYKQNNSSYNYNNHRYEIHKGLDCTGYVGGSMYQIFGNRFSEDGYVYLAKDMTQKYSEIFRGQFIPKEEVTQYQGGDIMSSKGHAYIVLGGCLDGSVVLLHASPPALSICGTYTPNGNPDSMAVFLAEKYMKKYFPECYGRYPNCSRNTAYLREYNQMKWNEDILTDSDWYRYMLADEILWDLFENVKIYLNSERMRFSIMPYISQYTTYVPLREFAESFGAEVYWNNSERIAEVRFGEKVLQTKPSDDSVMVNNSVMIPVRKIADFFGLTIEWEEHSKSIYLN